VFNGEPAAGLIADANGDLFGTTAQGGANGGGTVFEITGSSFVPLTFTTLITFNDTDGRYPEAGLIADANGDLFGTTDLGGVDEQGTVFDIVNSASGYANAPTTLAAFDGSDSGQPVAGVIADANGDRFGTTAAGGADGDGAVFEIAKTSAGYANEPTTLVSFNDNEGASPEAGLIADANGDLFGTTFEGGADGDGTVFEIAKTSAGYASAPTTLVSFTGADGANPEAGLVADANGDLFGTTSGGGVNEDGTVFEIVRTASGYGAPKTLISFDGSDGENPEAGLVADDWSRRFQ